MASQLPAESPHRAALDLLRGLDGEALDRSVFRLQAKHREPREGTPWAWQLVLCAGAPSEYVASLHRVARELRGSFDSISFMAQRSRDGPLSLEIRSELGKSKGGGGSGKGGKNANGNTGGGMGMGMGMGGGG
eukprot:4471169-Pyramimonas_sp.AAC.1